MIKKYFCDFIRNGLFGCLLLGMSLQAQEEGKVSELDRKLEGLYKRQQYEDAAKLLAEHIKGAKDDNIRRVELFKLLDYIGKTKQGIEVLKKGLRQKASDNQLLWYLGNAWLARGDDGPNVTRSGGTVTYHPSKMTEVEEAAWKKGEYKKAAAAFRDLLKNEPKHEESAALLVRSLQGGFTTEELAGEIVELAKKFPKNLAIGMLQCDVLIKKKELEKAVAILSGFREKSPRNSAVYGKLAEVYQAQGNKEKAKNSLARESFYEWMPPFTKSGYTVDLAKKVELLKSAKDGAKLKKMVDGFIAAKDQVSTDLMAAVCWRHLAHGPIENACFKELENRKEGELLVNLIENARSICTAREGGMALARMKHPEALRILSHLVVNDQRPVWITNAAGALETLADDKAVGILVETADPKFREADRQRSEEDARFMGDGPYHNRLRCILALGSFDTKESKKALVEAAKNPDLALASMFALYRLTKDEAYLKKGFAFKEKRWVFQYMVIPYIEKKIKDEKALAALKTWKEENVEKDEKSEKK